MSGSEGDVVVTSVGIVRRPPLGPALDDHAETTLSPAESRTAPLTGLLFVRVLAKN
jgi:hypothetical protein